MPRLFAFAALLLFGLLAALPARALVATPSPLDFGPVSAGTTVGPLTLTLTNDSTATVTITNPIFEDDPGDVYTVTLPADIYSRLLAPGEGIDISVEFSTPQGTFAGDYDALLTALDSNGGFVNALLQATVLQEGEVTLMPDVHDFGLLPLGDVNTPIDVVLANETNGDVVVTQFDPDDAYNAFTLVLPFTLPHTLAPGETATISARFSLLAPVGIEPAYGANFTFGYTMGGPEQYLQLQLYASIENTVPVDPVDPRESDDNGIFIGPCFLGALGF